MAPRGRRGLSSGQKRELWERWKRGESLSEIGRTLGKHAGSISAILASNGGIAPRVRTRSRQALTLAEREEISRGLGAGRSLRAIAQHLGRAPSTISREVSRNAGRARYRATRADERAWTQARRPKACQLAAHAPLRAVVAARLAQEWSPAQIAGWVPQAYPEDLTMRISHETIYRSLFIQARGVLKKE